MAKKAYYAVYRGRAPGIYTDWASTQLQISGFPHQSFKGFATREEAESAFEVYNRLQEGDYDSDGSASSDDGVRDAMHGAIPSPLASQPRGNVGAGVNRPVKKEVKVGDRGVEDGPVECSASKSQGQAKKKKWYPPRRKAKTDEGLEKSMAGLEISIRVPKA